MPVSFRQICMRLCAPRGNDRYKEDRSFNYEDPSDFRGFGLYSGFVRTKAEVLRAAQFSRSTIAREVKNLTFR